MSLCMPTIRQAEEHRQQSLCFERKALISEMIVTHCGVVGISVNSKYRHRSCPQGAEPQLCGGEHQLHLTLKIRFPIGSDERIGSDLASSVIEVTDDE